jgi:hypothetical protein
VNIFWNEREHKWHQITEDEHFRDFVWVCGREVNFYFVMVVDNREGREMGKERRGRRHTAYCNCELFIKEGRGDTRCINIDAYKV